VVLDTDVIVAAVRSRKGASAAWLRDVLRRKVVMLLSVPMALEYESVLKRPSQLAATGATEGNVDRFLSILFSRVEPVDLAFSWRPGARDPDDDMVLDTAINGLADWLLTFNERDFAAAPRYGVRVGRPGAVRQLIRQRGS